MTTVLVEPLPVLYACQGCPEFGQVARDTGALLDRTGRAQMIWLGAPVTPTLRERFPIYSLDGCGKGCARDWLAARGVIAEKSFAIM